MSAHVEAIYLAPGEGAPVQPVPEVEAVPGKGLVGDRTWRDEGIAEPGNELTLIQAEFVEPLADRLAPGAHRRQIVTRGVELNDLIGREFLVGPVRVRGIELCEPCAYLGGLTSPGIVRDLVHRAGLNAQILTGGVIRSGDPIVT